MESMPISKFKARALAVLEHVRTSGEPVLVTKRGEPIAEVVPATRGAGGERRLGALAGTGSLADDLIEPAGSGDWEALSA